MRDVVGDLAFGTILVVAGVLVTWFAATRGSPVMGALGVVYGVVGGVATCLQFRSSNEFEGLNSGVVRTVDAVSLSSAPEYVRENLPPSSKLVWMYLATEGGSTLDDVVRATQLSPRTARNAIDRLEEAEAVSKRLTDRGSRHLCYDISGSDDYLATDPDDDGWTLAGA